MENIFDIWSSRIPKYSSEFSDKLFQLMTKKGGGSEKSRVDLGKHFTNNYELYMYAFFLGLYRNENIAIPSGQKKVDFSHHIQYWGSKGNRLYRKDFTKLQDFMFMALVAKTDVDFIALDKGEISEKEVVKDLINTMESFTNGGLTLIQEKIEDNPNFFLQPTAFLDFITENHE
ncbi:glycoside hydrolase family 15 [Salibacter halophilus]|uniref:Glycoside hydrolase family 15 n=1 Tax=Salibacter halophilus TaxID=1803916 RepID=A0A6N6MAY1_9FLAO|nr:glycoside hydrolase family 15 [Salibacter halophilus]KAB1065607.1 glycoside hydrolase family 15 [Salibacter halophilus]